MQTYNIILGYRDGTSKVVVQVQANDDFDAVVFEAWTLLCKLTQPRATLPRSTHGWRHNVVTNFAMTHLVVDTSSQQAEHHQTKTGEHQ